MVVKLAGLLANEITGLTALTGRQEAHLINRGALEVRGMLVRRHIVTDGVVVREHHPLAQANPNRLRIRACRGDRDHVRQASLHGQEKNLGTWAICKMNMLLHGLSDARIEKGDTIRDPKLLHEGELLLYVRVIANPPFSLDEWGRDVAENDGYGRFRFGVPPKTKGDLAFVQHMVAVLNAGGQLGVVMPHGVLFRGSAEGKIRQGMLEEDLFEAVIGLPPNLFYGTGIPASILVLNRHKADARKGKVLFIDASGEFEEGSNQNRLRDRDIEHISKTVRSSHICASSLT